MAGGKDPYEVKESEKHPGEWAIYKNGTETRHHSKDRATMKGKSLRLNVRAHGG